MRRRDFLQPFSVIVVILVIWGVFIYPSNVHDIYERARSILGNPKAVVAVKTATSKTIAKCNPSSHCPPDHFAFHITSGAATIVGPNICFDGNIIMSNVLKNVGLGLNIVLVNGESGVIEKRDYLNMKNGDPAVFLAYMKAIQPGMIVLVASFGDVTPILTYEVREIFVGMGSDLITSVKYKDNWVFAGWAGTGTKSPFEKRGVNDVETNIYGAWPEIAELDGCLPRIS